MKKFSCFQRGNKQDPFHHFVRVEFNGVVVGESARRQEVDPSQGAVDYDFSCSFRCPDDRHSLDDMAHKPLIRKGTQSCSLGFAFCIVVFYFFSSRLCCNVLTDVSYFPPILFQIITFPCGKLTIPDMKPEFVCTT